MVDETLDSLQRVVELAPLLDADLTHCERRCQALRGQLRRLRSILGRVSVLREGFHDPVFEYIATVNGRRTRATAREIDKLRRKWRGDFLLDVPERLLRLRRGGQVLDLPLGNGELHRGIEHVLVRGMSSPGRPFGHLSVNSQLGNGHPIGSTVLSRYVFTIRHVIGDSGRRPRYLLGTDVDRPCSDTCRGYVFSDLWTYTVIERRRVCSDYSAHDA